jgi:integrase
LTEKVVAEIERYSIWHKEQQLKIGFRSEYVFTTGSGRFIDRHNLDTALERYLKKIGIDPDKHKAQKSRKFHAFRSTFGSNLCKQGVPIQVASELLGHDSIDVTKKYYVNIDDSQKQNAVEILARLYA